MTARSLAGTDAVVVGAGPNGLTAALTLARAGRSVTVLEGAQTVGGGSRSAELTLPGFVHDVCSAIHPLGRGSPILRQFQLERHGLRWIEPPVQLAHPLDDGSAILVRRDIDETSASLGVDARAYKALLRPVITDWDFLLGELAGPLRVPLNPVKVLRAAGFGLQAVLPFTRLARRFRTAPAKALLAGCAAHSILRLNQPLSGFFGILMLGSSHAIGWPFPEGGSQRIADALARHLKELGGRIETGVPVAAIDELPPNRAALLDVTPRQLLAIAGDRLRARPLGGIYIRQLERYRYAPGVFKIDVALDGPIPWRNEDVLRAGTVHLGGTAEEIHASEQDVGGRRTPPRPFVLLAQCSLFDATRAPAGKHAVWAYCHVPNGSREDMTDRIVGQIERFAPGFRDRILAVARRGPAELEAENPNYVGGDINGGLQSLRQFFTRPAVQIDPYRTPDPRILLCSASTPPGGGVHGLCGWHAARSALRGPLR
jgi:phytoene dehydrogenase-like protein